MNSAVPPKSLTWSLIQSYLTFLKNHENQIAKLISLKDDGILELPIVETKITGVIIQMHDTVVQILKENSMIQSESEKSKNEIINNLTIHKECKPDSSHEKIQKELDEMKAKFEVQKSHHVAALN